MALIFHFKCPFKCRLQYVSIWTSEKFCLYQAISPFLTMFLTLYGMALIFHYKCPFKCRLQFVSIWTSVKFCCLVMGLTTFSQRAL